MRFLNYVPQTDQQLGKHPVGMKGKASIRCTVWGQWWGYIGRRRVWEIGASSFDADQWLIEQQHIQSNRGAT